jgi:hypothetical protein
VPGVKLLLVVVVDQLGWDTLQRYRPALHGGLARLLDEGVVFRQCYHRHSETATAPGHATLVTGLEPRHHGVIANQWYDRATRQTVNAGEDARGEPSPVNLLATGIGDWVRQRDPWGRSYVASGKDYAAVMMGGKHPDGVFWYDEKLGVFTSSKAYPPYSVWVKRFGRQPVMGSLFGGLWWPLPLPPHVDPGALGVVQLAGPMIEPPFPHAFGGATTKATRRSTARSSTRRRSTATSPPSPAISSTASSSAPTRTSTTSGSPSPPSTASATATGRTAARSSTRWCGSTACSASCSTTSSSGSARAPWWWRSRPITAWRRCPSGSIASACPARARAPRTSPACRR